MGGSIEKGLLRKTGRAIGDFGLIGDGDRVMVALSGGKDSWTLLHLLERLRRKAPVRFSLVAVTVDPGFPGFRSDVVEAALREQGYEYHVERSNIYGVISEKLGGDEGAYCSFCARLRRGVLYRLAREMGCTKVALGHHADDLIESLLMSAFYNGELRSMPPKLLAEDGVNVVIRPLCYAFEDETAAFAQERGFPLINCGCPVCRGSARKRYKVKALLGALEDEQPGIKDNILAALGNLKPRYLMDKRFY
ncbi:MAG TPA: tRNA 2-thiocytidine(32) synthetase TtcA [Nitrospirota bacterium]|nr:tRNA 2-thiocytidine(32) synthetase TtcA [Nitrospirota bacterium]